MRDELEQEIIWIPLSVSVGGAVESLTMIDTNVLPKNTYLCES